MTFMFVLVKYMFIYECPELVCLSVTAGMIAHHILALLFWY